MTQISKTVAFHPTGLPCIPGIKRGIKMPKIGIAKALADCEVEWSKNGTSYCPRCKRMVERAFEKEAIDNPTKDLP